MAVHNDIDRFHLVKDVVDRVLSLGPRAAYLTQIIRDKLIDHQQGASSSRQPIGRSQRASRA